MSANPLRVTFTTVPNIIFDKWLPQLPPPQSLVVFFLCRMTYGWHKDEAALSVQKIQAGTGLSRTAVIEACNALCVPNGPIIRVQNFLPNGAQAPNCYQINTEWQDDNDGSYPCRKANVVAGGGTPDGQGGGTPDGPPPRTRGGPLYK